MKLSNYTIIVNDYPKTDEHLVYCTRTQAMVTVNQELRATIEDFESQTPALQERYTKDLSTLHDMGILVKNEEEDKQKITSFFNQLTYGLHDSCFAVTILTTYACNFKCVYCFEESSRVNVKMDMETASRVIHWLKQKMEHFGYEELALNFYGGEPLINTSILEYIVTYMQRWCQDNKLKFRFNLQTNGYLLKPSFIDQWVKWGLKEVRISVDGLASIHDCNRPLRGGGKTFDRIIENILASINKIKITISTGYERGEIGHIEDLLDYFDELGILHKLGNFMFSPIHPTLGPKGQPERIRNSECLCNYEDKNLVQAIHAIEKAMEKRNLPTKNGMAITKCSLTREYGGATIDPQGIIFKCNSMLGHPDLAVGNIHSDTYNEKHKEFIALNVWKKCPPSCAYLPMCGGGCRLSAFLKNQNFTTPSCHKDYLKKMAPEFIKKDYEKSIATSRI